MTMNIKKIEITIADLTDGYKDNGEEGVRGYGGKLDIRPPYQREFIYNDKQRDEVIRSVLNNYPLNVMYWVDRKDGNYEVLDGQQRSLSICQYVDKNFSLDGMYFHSQPENLAKRIKEYTLSVYVCEGEDSEKMNWFRIVNIAGVKLTEQELRNSLYTGPWLTEAKRYFSRTGQAAAAVADGYHNVKVNRQELLEKAISWAAGAKDDQSIMEYMSRHQKDTEVDELWNHFQLVIKWVKTTFPQPRPHLMKGVDWGPLYSEYGKETFDPEKLEEQVSNLLNLEGNVIKKKSGIYSYVLDGDEKHLNLRLFDTGQKTTAYEKQGGLCAICNKKFEFNEMEGDHITPWKKGGLTVIDNLQMLCNPCNRRKSSR